MYCLSISKFALAFSAFGPVGASFDVGLELLGRLRQLAEVQVRLAEHEVRLGVLVVRLDRRREQLLRLGEVVAVPGDDALVVERVGVAGRRRRRGTASFAPSALIACASLNFFCAL